MSGRRQLANVGDRVRVYRELRGKLPDGTLYRALAGVEGRVVERNGEQLVLDVGKYGARCPADQGDVELVKRAKRPSTTGNPVAPLGPGAMS